jgi:CubicO group peptidase (beta-lactamase class C family)
VSHDDVGELHDRMAGHVHDGGVGGLVWAVSVAGRVASGAAGWLDPGPGVGPGDRQRPMPADAVFRLSSVTKPIAAVAALQLVDAGLIGLDDPVDEVLPELADRQVLVDPTGPLDQATVPAERPLTLRDLLSFRCGLGMDFDFSVPQPHLDRLWELGIGPGPMAPACSPDELLAQLGALPLVDQPGTRWRYHTGSDIAGVLVERVRGETVDVVLARDVLEPAGMVDTGFWARPDQLDRFGACRSVDGDGSLVTWDEPDGRWAAPPSFRSGAAGLLSTPADLLAFGRVLLSGGEGPHGRVLSAALVAEMTRDQLTEQQRSVARIDGEGAGLGWGLGVGVRSEAAPGGWPPAGSYGWDGGLGSRWLVDPDRDLCAVVLCTDAYDSPASSALLDDFVAGLAPG